jgi:citrate synthase
MSILHENLTSQAEALRAKRAALLKERGETVLGSVTIEQVLGGMRGVPALVCDTSSVSADEGLRIRNTPILELTDITPEETFWLLVTGKRATDDERKELSGIFAKYYAVPQYVVDTLKSMPKDSHPMAMLSVGLLAMERESEFRAAYDKGAGKDVLWQSMVNCDLPHPL